MIQHIFATMNEVLDEIMLQYPTADAVQRDELDEKLSVLKSMSDVFIEEWLRFEEKIGKLQEQCQLQPNSAAESADPLTDQGHPAKHSDAFVKGQGYYKLLMFREAINEFDRLIRQYPDFVLGRIYLAMGYLRSGDYPEAYRHFQILLPLTDNRKMQAISYNAMGCIQARNDNTEKARELFKMAYQTDPSCMAPLVNMGICIQKNGVLQITSDFTRD